MSHKYTFLVSDDKIMVSTVTTQVKPTETSVFEFPY